MTERDTSYFDDNLGEYDEEHYHRCQKLGRAIIAQAVIDMTREYGQWSWKFKKESLKQQARRWLTRNSDDLHTICDLAGVHHDDVIRNAIKIIPESPYSPPVVRQRKVAKRSQNHILRLMARASLARVLEVTDIEMMALAAAEKAKHLSFMEMYVR